jgi:cytochrome c oxidase subunit 2
LFQVNRLTIAGAALLLAVLACASPDAIDPDDSKPSDENRAAITTSLDALPEGDAASGEALFSGEKSPAGGEDLACHACHSLDGSSGVGPSLKDIAAHVPDGYTSTADYLYESILFPEKVIHSGFIGGIMPPNFAKRLDEQSLADLIAFLESQ